MTSTTLWEGSAQIVDAPGEQIEFWIGELRLHALRKIAPDGGIHDLAEGALQLLHHGGAVDAALLA